MDDFASLLYGDEPTAQERMQRLAAQLQRRQAVGQLASLIGGPAKDFGATLTRGAEQGLQQLAEAPGQRLQMALQRQKVGEGERRTDPNSPRTQMGLSLLQRLGQKAPAGATAADIEATLPLVERATEAEQRSKDRALQRHAMKQQQDALLGNLGEDTLNALADKFAAGGGLPPLGMGKAAGPVRLAIMQRATERHPGIDLARAEAGYKADSNSLKQLQLQSDRIDAAEKTAIANLDRAVTAARQVVDVGSPWFNKPLRAAAQGLAGSPQQQAFLTARQVAVQEVAKVLSGALGNAPVSDSMRHEVEALMGPDASLAQILAAADMLKQDMASRQSSTHGQLGEIRSRVGGGGNTPASATISSTSGNVGGLDPEKKRRLEELRAKRAAGTLQ